MLLRTHIYYLATHVFDWGLPLLTPLAEWVRDITWNEELYD